jgi:hypothetical protein
MQKKQLKSFSVALDYVSELACSDKKANFEELIVDLACGVDLSRIAPNMVNDAFFSHLHTATRRMPDGIIETRESIAQLIVALAYKYWSQKNQLPTDQTTIPSWLDPCSGGGVFVLAILKHQFETNNISSHLNLPRVGFVEKSPIGFFSTLCAIKIFLESHSIRLDDYVANGLLKPMLGDFLIMHPEHPSLFENSNNYNLIVGNPPYVRASRLTLQYKRILSNLFPSSYNGNSDLYAYFIASALTKLYAKGTLAYISPAAFTRASNGGAIRKHIKKNASIDCFVDLDETKVFEDASVHSAIYLLSKSTEQSSIVQYDHISTDLELENLCQSKHPRFEAVFDKQADGWAFHKSDHEYRDFQRRFSGCKPLISHGFEVYSGVRPGLTKAFIYESDALKSISKKALVRWFRKIVLPANLKRWEGMRRCHYLLFTPTGITALDDEIENLLAPYRPELMKRSEVEKGTEWYALRSCGYYHEMGKRKIAFPDLSLNQRFSLLPSDVFVADGAYFINSEDTLLLGILNSSVAEKYFSMRCSSVGTLGGKGRYRFKKVYVQNFPLPEKFPQDGPIHTAIRRTVDEILSQGESVERMKDLNELVCSFYEGAMD